jgi:hypothetical protein
MTLEEFLVRVRAVPWSRLAGAYGPSDGSASRRATREDGAEIELRLGDVPGALAALAEAASDDEDYWMDAIDTLYAHVTHQGELFEVTAHVIPLVGSLVAARGDAVGAELAEFVAYCGDRAAIYAGSGEPAWQAIGRACQDALRAPAGAVELPPRAPSPPPVIAQETIERELHRHLGLVPGATYMVQRAGLNAATAWGDRAPALALQVAEAITHAALRVPASLARATALVGVGRVDEGIAALRALATAALGPGEVRRALDRRTVIAAIDRVAAPSLAEVRAALAASPDAEIEWGEGDEL